jgi:hypothetical protein
MLQGWRTSRIINKTEKLIEENERYLAQLRAPGPVSTYKIDNLIRDTDRFIQRFDRENPDIAEQIRKRIRGPWPDAADYMKKYGDYNPADIWKRWLKAEFPGVPANASGGLTPEQAGKMLSGRILNEPDKPGIIERMTDSLVKRPKIVTALSLFGLGAGISANVVDADDRPLEFLDYYVAADYMGKAKEVGHVEFYTPKDYYLVEVRCIVKNKKSYDWGPHAAAGVHDVTDLHVELEDARLYYGGRALSDVFPFDGKYDEAIELVTTKKFDYYLWEPDDKLEFTWITWLDFPNDEYEFVSFDFKTLPNLSAPVPEKFRTDPKSPKYQPIIDELKHNLGPLVAISAVSVGTPIGMYYWLRKRKKDSD